MTDMKQRKGFCVTRCLDFALPRLVQMMESCWLDGANMVAKKIAEEVLDSDGGTVMVCGIEVMPVFPDTAPELVEKLRKAIIALAKVG